MGPLGLTGPQGLPGVSGQVLTSTTLADVSLLANAQTTMEVTCPTGKRVLGGGWESGANLNLSVVSSFPPTQSSWRVTVRLSQDTSATFKLQVWAVCATAN
ncbi:MAG: hypothetical protein JF613_07955 [Acidobacteria bacterium]|nr:hypothetical protein [Acidobacteriota bacterium]